MLCDLKIKEHLSPELLRVLVIYTSSWCRLMIRQVDSEQAWQWGDATIVRETLQGIGTRWRPYAIALQPWIISPALSMFRASCRWTFLEETYDVQIQRALILAHIRDWSILLKNKLEFTNLQICAPTEQMAIWWTKQVRLNCLCLHSIGNAFCQANDDE